MEDKNAGMGGSYVVGKDGQRKLVERTKEPVPVSKPSDAAQPAPASGTSTTGKE